MVSHPCFIWHDRAERPPCKSRLIPQPCVDDLRMQPSGRGSSSSTKYTITYLWTCVSTTIAYLPTGYSYMLTNVYSVNVDMAPWIVQAALLVPIPHATAIIDANTAPLRQ